MEVFQVIAIESCNDIGFELRYHLIGSGDSRFAARREVHFANMVVPIVSASLDQALSLKPGYESRDVLRGDTERACQFCSA